DYFLTLTADPGCSWLASANFGWISFPDRRSGQGSASVRFRVVNNGVAFPRQATITVNFSDGKRTSGVVTQNSSSCSFSFNPPWASFPAAGGNGSFTVQSSPPGCWWDIGSQVPWTFITRDYASPIVSYQVYQNLTPARSGLITLSTDPPNQPSFK